MSLPGNDTWWLDTYTREEWFRAMGEKLDALQREVEEHDRRLDEIEEEIKAWRRSLNGKS